MLAFLVTISFLPGFAGEGKPLACRREADRDESRKIPH
jgi:hypothetical protein